MSIIKQLAIYMDDSNAILMELENKLIVSRVITNDFKEGIENLNYEVIDNVSHSEEVDQIEWSNYNQISDVIKHYNQVVIFGPTNAKNELLKQLKENHHFKDSTFKLVNTDAMNSCEMHDFVNEYYK